MISYVVVGILIYISTFAFSLIIGQTIGAGPYEAGLVVCAISILCSVMVVCTMVIVNTIKKTMKPSVKET